MAICIRILLALLLCAAISQAQVVPYPTQFLPGPAPVVTQGGAGPNIGPLTIQGSNNSTTGGNSNAVYAGVQIVGGTTTGTNVRGGNVFLTGGQDTDQTGQETGGILITDGACFGSPTNCNTGLIKITTQNAVGSTGLSHDFDVIMGSSSSSAVTTVSVGNIGLFAGATNGNAGGAVQLTAGASTLDNGGDVLLQGGGGGGSNRNGNVTVSGTDGGGSTTAGAFGVVDNGSAGNPDFQVSLRDGGAQISTAGSAPTGGDKGTGTLNIATGLYINGNTSLVASTLTFANAATNITVTGGTTSGATGSLTIAAGTSSFSGTGTSAGGSLSLNAGNGGSSSGGQAGGTVNINGGTGGSAGTTAGGGGVNVTGGIGGAGASSSANGGNVVLTGGAGGNAARNATGGNITLTPGLGSGTNAAVSGLITLNGLTTGTNADFVCLSGSGVVLVQTSACTISSKRFKTDIHPLQSDALGEIAKLPVETFRLKAKNVDPNATTDQIGLIAEDIARIEPRCAIYERDMKTPKSYRQECVIAMLVKAVQEQQKEITRLERGR